MHHTILTGQDLHEGSEVSGTHHFARVDFANLGFLGQPLDDLDSFLATGFISRSDVDRAVILHVNFDAGVFDDLADGLATRADDSTDLFWVYLDQGDARSIG